MRLGSSIKRCYFLFVAILTAAMVFGCSHGSIRIQDDGGDEGDFPASYDVPELAVSLAEVRLHVIELAFESEMLEETVEVVIRDDGGDEFEPIRSTWSANSKSFVIAGPFQYCRTYGLTFKAGAEDHYGHVLEEDVTMEIPIGPNPLDIDLSATCSSDTIISPVFTENVDGMIMLGDTAAATDGAQSVIPGDINTNAVWYTDGSAEYDYANRMTIIPELKGIGSNGAAKLFVNESGGQKHFELNIWDFYEPIDELPTTTLSYSVSSASSEELLGPYDAGDLNGDDAHEIMLSAEKNTSEYNALQRVLVLQGPIARGNGLLTDAAAVNTLVGSLDGVIEPFVSIGDVDDDGFDDMAAISYNVSGSGVTSGWHVKVARGNADLSSIFLTSNMEEITGALGYDILDVGGGDFNGDGINDIFIADAKRAYVFGETMHNKPRVKIIFGGQSFGETHIEQANIELRPYVSYLNYVDIFKVRNLRDINGDGIDDLAIGTTEETYRGTPSMSNVYVMLGRLSWQEVISLGPYIDPEWSLKISSDSSHRLVIKDDFWDARIGDIDNDGFYDFMLKVVSFDGQEVVLFPGEASALTFGRVVELDEAIASWSFSAE